MIREKKEKYKWHTVILKSKRSRMISKITTTMATPTLPGVGKTTNRVIMAYTNNRP
jgi:hypothetical protein